MMGAEIENKKVELRVFTSVGFSDPSILIVYSGDIVLAKVTSRLHLNDFQGRRFEIFQSMDTPLWNVGRLIFQQIQNLIAPSYTRFPPNNDPVLGSMLVFL